MITKRVRSWNGFLQVIKELRSEFEVIKGVTEDGKLYERTNQPILFRGQSNSKWKLETTLERSSSNNFHVLEYLQQAVGHVHEIESFTGEKWKTPSFPQLREELSKEGNVLHSLPAYDYLVYLRHHGYPSPLLDWTTSPFIAAYFAFFEQSVKSASVYSYIERPYGGKGGLVGKPMISVQGPFVTTHKRHFAQKAWYTFATRWDYSNERHYFCSHESVFDQNKHEQDVLIKIDLPNSLRKEVLGHLNDFNINHFTLFQTEDSLIRALASKSFDLK